MSIQPIDLQTLFVKMNHVGKEQAVNKESTILQQEIQGSEIVKKNQHDDSSVNRTENSGDGPEKVREDRENDGKHGKGENQKKKNDASKNKEILSDPDLGKNVDFSG
jgi:hypothetical protein